MGFTVGDVMAAHPDVMSTAKAGWVTLADQLDHAVEDLTRGAGDLPYYWQGPGADGAEQRRIKLCTQISDLQMHVKDLTHRFDDWADAVRNAQLSLRHIADDAATHQIHIDLTSGRVTGAAGVTQDAVDGYVAQLDDTLKRLAATDSDVTGWFAEDLPRLKTVLAGAVSHTFKDENGYGIDTRNLVQSIQQGDAAGVSKSWAQLSSADQEQLLLQDSELFGNLDGIPARDRDAANRYTMGKNKAALLQEQAELQAHPGLSTALRLLTVRRQLTAIDVMSVPDDSGQYLTTWSSVAPTDGSRRGSYSQPDQWG